MSSTRSEGEGNDERRTHPLRVDERLILGEGHGGRDGSRGGRVVNGGTGSARVEGEG